MMVGRGCEKESSVIGLPYAPELRRCPKSQIPPEAWQHIHNWHRWRTFGALPYGGTFDEQPLYIAQGIETASAAFADGQRGAGPNG